MESFTDPIRTVLTAVTGAGRISSFDNAIVEAEAAIARSWAYNDALIALERAENFHASSAESDKEDKKL